jgi:prepilin-type N-terminal cleavage/methylation domain-containing protein
MGGRVIESSAPMNSKNHEALEMKRCRGFTLIERMNVVSVIGVLFSIAITNDRHYVSYPDHRIQTIVAR